MGSALVRFSVRQHAWPESLSKRAPSTTRTSLRFRINDLRAVWISVAQTPPSNRPVPRCDLYSAVCGRAETDRRRNCVRALNVARLLTAISLSCCRVSQVSGLLTRRLRLRQLPRTVQDLRQWVIEPHRVVPALHGSIIALSRSNHGLRWTKRSSDWKKRRS